MKPETFEFLLDCYLKERVPNFGNQLEASQGSLLLKGHFPISYAPQGPIPTKQLSDKQTSFIYGQLAKRQILETDSPLCTDEVDALQNLSETLSPTLQARQQMFAESGIQTTLSNTEKRKCVEVARKLLQIADNFGKNEQISPLESNVHELLQSSPQGFTDEELNVLRRIHSEKVFSVPKIASYLSECLTPQTFRKTLQFLCYHCTSMPLEVALAFELSAEVIQRVGGHSPLGLVNSGISEYFQSRTNLEELENDDT